MDWVCYDLSTRGDLWELRSTDSANLNTFVSFKAAIDYARRAAHTRWSVHDRPSCVRVKTSSGGDWLTTVQCGPGE